MAKINELLKAQRAPCAPCALDKDQERLWTETRTAMLVSCPMFSHLLYTMLASKRTNHVAFFTKDVPIAATDNYEIFFNPETYFKFSLPERVFVLAHEIMHCVFNHPGQMYQWRITGKVVTSAGKSLPYEPMIMNMAMDYIINDLLIESKVGKMPQGAGLHDKDIAVSTDSTVDTYHKLFKNMGGQGGGGGGGGGGSGGFDIILDPGQGGGGPDQGKDPSTAANARSAQEWTTAVAGAAAAAKLQGKLPAAIEKMFMGILEPTVDWTDQIKSFFSRKVGSGGYDWRRADRQLITRDEPVFAPGRSGYGCGTIVVGMDSSGSIYADPTLIDRFMAELGGILSDLRPKRIVVIWCDAKVQRVDEVEDASDLDKIRRLGAKGGGGTAFEPVFDEIKVMGLEPDALVYLTDGCGSFPRQAPSYPLLWGNISPNQKYPFGDVVDIPLQS